MSRSPGSRSLSPSDESRFVPHSSVVGATSVVDSHFASSSRAIINNNNNNNKSHDPMSRGVIIADDEENSIVGLLGATICFTPVNSPRSSPNMEGVRDDLSCGNSSNNYIGSLRGYSTGDNGGVEGAIAGRMSIRKIASSLDGLSTTEDEILDGISSKGSIEIDELSLDEESPSTFLPSINISDEDQDNNLGLTSNSDISLVKESKCSKKQCLDLPPTGSVTVGIVNKCKQIMSGLKVVANWCVSNSSTSFIIGVIVMCTMLISVISWSRWSTDTTSVYDRHYYVSTKSSSFISIPLWELSLSPMFAGTSDVVYDAAPDEVGQNSWKIAEEGAAEAEAAKIAEDKRLAAEEYAAKAEAAWIAEEFKLAEEAAKVKAASEAKADAAEVEEARIAEEVVEEAWIAEELKLAEEVVEEAWIAEELKLAEEVVEEARIAEELTTDKDILGLHAMTKLIIDFFQSLVSKLVHLIEKLGANDIGRLLTIYTGYTLTLLLVHML